MTFQRVKPYGWQVNEKVTSPQLNQLDIDHAKAVDKTGDNVATGGGISGEVDVLSGASIDVLASGSISFAGIAPGNVIGDFAQLIMDGYSIQLFNSAATLEFASGSVLTQFSGAEFFLLGLTQIGKQFGDPGGELRLVNGTFLTIDTGAQQNVNNGGWISINNDGYMQVLAGGAINGLTSGFLNWAGFVNFESGSVVDFASGSTSTVEGSLTVESGGLLQTAVGSTTNFNAQVNMFNGTNGYATLFSPWAGINTGQLERKVFSNFMLQSTGTSNFPTIQVGSVANGVTAYLSVHYVYRDSSNTALSGGGTFNAMMYNKSGSLTGNDSSFYGLVGTAALNDLALSVGSGTNFNILVNGNGLANNVEWVLDVEIIYT